MKLLFSVLLLVYGVFAAPNDKFYTHPLSIYSSDTNRFLSGELKTRTQSFLGDVVNKTNVAIILHGIGSDITADALPALSNVLLSQVPHIGATFRFNFEGHGSSSGVWEWGMYGRDMNQLEDAVKKLIQLNYNPYVIIGYGKSAATALFHASNYGSADNYVALAPRFNLSRGIPANYLTIEDKLRINDYYPSSFDRPTFITKASIDERLGINTAVEIDSKIGVFITRGALDIVTPPEDSVSYHNIIPQSKLDIVPDADQYYNGTSRAVMLNQVIGFLNGTTSNNLDLSGYFTQPISIPLVSEYILTAELTTREFYQTRSLKTGAFAKPGPFNVAVLLPSLFGSSSSDFLPELANSLLDNTPELQGVVRLNLQGKGASEGEWDYAKYQRDVDDIRGTVTYLRQALNMNVMTLVGYGKSANSAFFYADKFKFDIPIYVCLAPRFNMTEVAYFNQTIVDQVYSQGSVDVSSFVTISTTSTNSVAVLKKSSLEERLAVNNSKFAGLDSTAHFFLIHGAADTVTPVSELNSWKNILPTAQTATIANGDMAFSGASRATFLAQVSTFLRDAFAASPKSPAPMNGAYFSQPISVYSSASNSPLLVGELKSRDPKIKGEFSNRPKVVIVCHGIGGDITNDPVSQVTDGILNQVDEVDAVFRINFQGHGSSEGVWEYAMYERDVEELENTVQKLKDLYFNVVGVVTIGKSSATALLHASKYRTIPSLVIMGPRYDFTKGMPESYLNLTQNLELTTFYPSNFNRKTYVTPESIRERLEINNGSFVSNIPNGISIFIIAGAIDQTTPPTDSILYKNFLPQAQLKYIPFADQLYNGTSRVDLVNSIAAFWDGITLQQPEFGGYFTQPLALYSKPGNSSSNIITGQLTTKVAYSSRQALTSTFNVAIITSSRDGNVNTDFLPELTRGLLDNIPSLDGVVRIDRQGNGASEGQWSYTSFDRDASDINATVSLLREFKMNVVACIGYGKGANSVLVYADTFKSEVPMIVSIGARYNFSEGIIFPQSVQNQANSQGSVDVSSYVTVINTFGAIPYLTKADLAERFSRDNSKLAGLDSTTKILLIHGESDSITPVADVRSFAAIFPSAAVEIIPGATQSFLGTTRSTLVSKVSAFLNNGQGGGGNVVNGASHVSASFNIFFSIVAVFMILLARE